MANAKTHLLRVKPDVRRQSASLAIAIWSCLARHFWLACRGIFLKKFFVEDICKTCKLRTAFDETQN